MLTLRHVRAASADHAQDFKRPRRTRVNTIDKPSLSRLTQMLGQFLQLLVRDTELRFFGLIQAVSEADLFRPDDAIETDIAGLV